MFFQTIITATFLFFAVKFYLNWGKYEISLIKLLGTDQESSCARPKTLEDIEDPKIREAMETLRITAYKAFKQFVIAIIVYAAILIGAIYTQDSEVFYIFSVQLLAAFLIVSAFLKAKLYEKLLNLNKEAKKEIVKTKKSLKISTICCNISGVSFLILLAKILFF